MARVKYVSELKLGDVISYYDIDYNNETFEHYEAMLVALERRKNYTWHKFTWYKFMLIASDTSRYADGLYLYLRYYGEHARINFLYNVKDIIGIRRTTNGNREKC